MDKVLFQDKGEMSTSEFAAFLRMVADRLEAGQMTMARGEQSITMDVPKRVDTRINVKDDISRSGTKRKVQLGFRWRLGEENQPEKGGLTIS
ncbi:MAG: amphi-Trp domain-containing protein [Magnetococcales bacterium]|nr:amphi-Trp domain-containing protein [Magnetococcales bacterium]